MPNFYIPYHLPYPMATTSHNARIELAIAHLNRQDKPNIMGTANEYQLVESTLRRRFKGQCTSRQAAVGTTATTRHARKYTAISALQERNITAVLRVLIAWRSETSEQCSRCSLLGAVRQLSTQYIYRLESVVR